MNSIPADLLDKTWESRNVSLPTGRKTVQVKQCATFKEASAICDQFGDLGHRQGYALFIGESPEPTAYTSEDLMRFAESEDLPPDEPWYEEVVFVRSANFEEMLGFIDLYNFGKDAERPSVQLHGEARALLEWVKERGEFRFKQINGLIVSGVFMQTLSPGAWSEVLERVYGFNSKYFSTELPKQSWQRGCVKSNSFSLGPC